MEPSRGSAAWLRHYGSPALVVLAGIVVFIWKLRIVAPIQYVGHADASGYAEMADSLLRGRGLHVDYISWYFRHYAPGIVRPEDHWPPFYSFLIAPFFAVMGKTALAAKLPSLLISCFGFPLIVHALALRVARSRVVAIASAFTILLYLPVFEWSLHCLSDVTFAFLVTCGVYCLIRGWDDSRWFYGMGPCFAASYLAKGSAIILLPAVVASYVVWRIARRPARRWMRRDARFAAGVVLVGVLLLPWFVRNTMAFGNPLYSTQNHASGYIGWVGWEEGTYRLYWGEDIPSFRQKLHEPQRLATMSWRYLQQHAWWLFVRMDAKTGEWDKADASTYALGLPAALTFLAGGLAAGMGAARRRSRARRGFAVTVWRALRWAARPEFAAFVLISAAHLAFLSICWEPISRLVIPAMPLVIIPGWTAIRRVLSALTTGRRWLRFAPTVVLLLLAGVWSWHETGRLQEAQAQRGYPWREADQGWQNVGKWIRENAPGSITMTRNPWELHFYSEELAVQIPLAPLKRVIEVARYYGVTHLIPEARRPELKPWVEGQIPGLTKLHESEGVALYSIDYGALPADLLDP